MLQLKSEVRHAFYIPIQLDLTMFSSILAFLVLLNPFALFLYLEPVRVEMSIKNFAVALSKAGLISLSIFITFALSGLSLFEHVFQISFESFRIFGGIILATFAGLYILKGSQTMSFMRGSLEDLPTHIAMPYMVGAGTITLSILFGKEIGYLPAVLALTISVLVTVLFVIGFAVFRKCINKQSMQLVFDRFMSILLRINGFILGAIGIDMIQIGIRNLFL